MQYSGNYSYEVDSSTCPVENFRLSNSWGGESGLDQIYIHCTNAAGVFTSIDNVYLESPGFACLAGTYFNNCNQSTPAGSFSGGHCTSNTAIGLVDQANDHLTVSHMKEYGCGGNAAGGAFISGPTIWSIDHSEFTANVGYGLFANAGAGSLEGNVFQGNGGNGIAAATGIVALSTHGNIVYTNTAGNLSVGTISNLSNSGDWCGSSATSLAACVW